MIPDAARKFRFTIQLSRTDLIPVGGRDYECEGAYTTLTFDADGKAVVELMGGESVTLKDIVAGTAFTVTEDNYASEAYFPTPASGVVSGTVTTQVQTAAFTNTRNTAELTVRKTLGRQRGLWRQTVRDYRTAYRRKRCGCQRRVSLYRHRRLYAGQREDYRGQKRQSAG